MLDPCKVCLPKYCYCDQCWFGYISDREKHERFKDVLINYAKDSNCFCFGYAERYIKMNPDWRSELEFKEEKFHD